MSSRAPLLLFVALAAAGCGSSASTSTSVTSPASGRCEAAVSSSAASFGAAGGTGTLNVAVARECSWRATSPVSWITFTSAAEGQGDGSVAYSVAANADPVSRQASVSVADRQVPLTQQGAPCQYVVGDIPSSFGSQGDAVDVDLRTHSACAWTASSNAAWATIAPASGRGDAVLRITVAPNTGSDPRSAAFAVADRQLTVTQASTPVPAPQPPAPAPTPSPTPTPSPSPTPTPTPSPTPTPPPPPPSPTPPPAPEPVSPIQLQGTVANLSGACPTWSFTLGAYAVFTTTTTVYERGPCHGMRDGRALEVTGWLMSDGTVRADEIRYGN